MHECKRARNNCDCNIRGCWHGCALGLLGGYPGRKWVYIGEAEQRGKNSLSRSAPDLHSFLAQRPAALAPGDRVNSKFEYSGDIVRIRVMVRVRVGG